MTVRRAWLLSIALVAWPCGCGDTGSMAGESDGEATTGDELPAPDFYAGRPLLIAHRGGAREFPEHTLFAYREAKKLGTDVLELDIHRSADGELMLIHDDTVDRTTDGTGSVRDMTFAELRQLDAGYWFTTDDGATYPHRGTGLQIPTLDEALAGHPDALFALEIKDGNDDAIEPLIATLRAAGMTDQVTVAAFSGATIEAFRAQAPEIATALSGSEMIAFFALTDATEPDYEPPGVFLQAPLEISGFTGLTQERTARADRLGMRVQPWTINDEAEMRMLLDWGAHGVMTDFPTTLRSVLDERLD